MKGFETIDYAQVAAQLAIAIIGGLPCRKGLGLSEKAY